MPKSLLTLSAIHKRDRNRRPSLSSSQHKIVSPKIAPTGPNGIPAFVLKRSPPQAIKHTATKHPFQARSLPARPPATVSPTKDDDDDDASSTAGSDMEVDIEALDDDDSLTSYAFRKPRRRPSESTVTPASSYADVTGPPPVPASASKTVSAHELAEVYLSALLSATPGALPIRRINAHLVEMVPSFAALPPPKQRRLVVKALEGRKGELFEKVSWGTWSYMGHNPQLIAASAPGNMQYQHAKKLHKKSEKIDDVSSYPVLFSFDNDVDSSSEESDWSAGDDDTDEEDWRAIGAAGILERCARRESQSRMQAFDMRREISRDDEDAAIEALVRMSESY